MVKMPEMTDKDFDARGEYFDVGEYEAGILSAKRGKSENTGSEFIEFEVQDANGDAKTSTRLYLTEKSAPYTRSTLAGIAVHNQQDDAGKDKVREFFKGITDTDKFDDKFLARYEGDTAFIRVEEDKNAPKPNGGFYLRASLFHYMPKPKKPTVEDIMGGGTPVNDPNDIPF